MTAPAPPLEASRFPQARTPARSVPAVIAAGLLAAAAGGAVEAFWRSQGLEPAVQDTPTLWAIQRARAEGRSFGSVFGDAALPAPGSPAPGARVPGSPVVLVGASRMHLGFDVDLCRRRLPDRTICQLALPGVPPWAVLHDLATDPDFPPASGEGPDAAAPAVVLLSGSPNLFTTSQLRDGAEYPARARRGVSMTAEWEARLSAAVQGRVAAMSPEVSHQAILTQVRQGHSIVPALRRTMRADRAARFVQAAPDPAFLRKQAALVRQLATFPRDPADRAAAVAAVADDVARLRARGVTVALLLFPVGGELVDAERARFPRSAADGWDRLVADLKPDAAVHHEDLPSSGAFYCPDCSHLDAASATRFSDEALDELERRGVL